MIQASASTKTNFPVTNLSIKQLNNAIITKSQLVITLKGLDESCLFLNLPDSFRRRIKLTGIGSLLKNRLYLLPNKNYYFVFNLWGAGYHHWLTEVAIKFVLFEEDLRKGTILVPPNCPNFIKDFLKLFDFSNVEEQKGNSFCRELNVISNPNSGHYDSGALLKLKEKIFDKLTIKKGSSKKVYISRKKSRARKVINEKELVEFLVKRGFTNVELDELPFIEQVKLFSSCDFLVSIHGAGLTNCIFMPPKSSIIELFPVYENEIEHLNACYYRLSKALNHNHRYLFCEREFPDRKFFLDEDNIYVDMDNFSHLLEDYYNL